MARREKEVETEQEKLDPGVEAGLDVLRLAFASVGYPNGAMQALAELAMLEYRLSTRALDRSKWFSSLLQVAKACEGAVVDEDEPAQSPGFATGAGFDVWPEQERKERERSMVGVKDSRDLTATEVDLRGMEDDED